MLLRIFDKNLTRQTFIQYVKKGNVVFDIGANKGDATIVFSTLSGKKGKVYAFEPVLSTYQFLKEHINKEQIFDNVQFENLALGNTEKKSIIYIPGEDYGQASLKIQDAGSWNQEKKIREVEINVITLDQFVEKSGINKLDFIKCDVEGFEKFVIEGGRNTIKRFNPTLYVEVFYGWTKNFGYTPYDLYNLISSLGYSEIYLVKDKVIKISDPQKDLSPENFNISADFLCIGK